MNYEEFLESKKLRVEACGIEPQDEINPKLFDFQRDIVRWSLKKGKSAVFAGCGLGKTAVQLTWSHHIHMATGGNVLILAPLAVAPQTVEEGKKFDIDVNIIETPEDIKPGINITNYEKLHKFDPDDFVGIVLDESGCIKHYNSKTRTAIIEAFQDTPYKLACSATPSPNDHAELGNHSEFLGIMKRSEMLSTFFVHDSKPGQHSKDQGLGKEKWRLKGHAVKAFWEWVASWAVMMQLPSDLGYEDGNFILPELKYHQITVSPENSAFEGEAITLQERRLARRESIDVRLHAVSEVPYDGKLLIWCGLNAEQDALKKHFGDKCVSIQGSTPLDARIKMEQEWRLGNVPILISKPDIFGFGVNWQHCNSMAFVGLSDSFEQLYQSVRRCWRFGQTKPVNAYIITSKAEGAVVRNIEQKERKFNDMLSGMISATSEINKANLKATSGEKDMLEHEVTTGNGWEMRLGDCCEELKTLEDNSIHYSIFSPPFKNIFVYSNSDRDVGNCRNAEEFESHMGFVAAELHRVLMPGRLISVHCADIPAFKYKEGFSGLQDLPGMLIRIFQKVGFVYHSRVTIYKSPVTEMYRTKTQGLLYKQLKKDSSVSRQGMADYIITMRKLGDNPEPITHTEQTFPLPAWQKYADPVWMDICQTNTLNNKSVREYEDEKHVCPLQLEVIDRCLELWTNEGDIVLSPFAGIGSEGYAAIQKGRRFIGFELKRSYYEQACDYIKQAETAARPDQVTLFRFESGKTEQATLFGT